MKKTNFFKLLTVGVTALALGFASCNHVKEADFDKICKEIDAMKLSISEIQTELDALSYVTSVKPTGNENEWLVTDNKGNTVTIKVTTGTGDVAPGTLIVGENGNWFIDTKDTGVKANATSPRITNDGDQNYWEFPVFNADGTITWTRGDKAPAYTYAVKNADGTWSLWIPEKGDLTKLVKIDLPGALNGVGKIDILGWIQGKGDVSENIALGGAGSPLENGRDDAFVVNYAHISKFQLDHAATSYTDAPARTYLGLPSGAYTALKFYAHTSGDLADATKDEFGTEFWSAMTDVKKGNVLNTLNAERKGLLIQVSPAGNLADVQFTLNNSKGAALPLKMGTPELITGLLTRDLTSNVWFIPWTYEGPEVTYTDGPAYEAKYVTDAVVTLTTADGVRSEYTPFTFSARPVVSREAPVGVLKPGDVARATNGSAPGLTYKVQVGQPYTIGFEYDTAVLPAIPDHPLLPVQDGSIWKTGAVQDYYVTVKDNNEYVRTQFGITIDKKAGTFTVGRMPDDMTLASFVLTVHKLGIDGIVYREDIIVYPTRGEAGDIIFNGDYLITDVNTMATPGNTGVTPATGFLSAKKDIVMTPMFTKLQGIPSGINGMTMEQRWQNIQYGAKSWDLTKVTIGGKAVNGSDYVDPFQIGGVKPTLAAWKTMFFNAGSQITFVGATGETALAAGDLYQARRVIFQPAYVRNDGMTPLFDVAQEYVLTFEFKDSDGDYLSTATVIVKPQIPLMAELFVKENVYWNQTTTPWTLNAYYKNPSAPWANTWFYDNNHDGATDDAPFMWSPQTAGEGATYYNVFANTANSSSHKNTTPYDSGFTKFGQANGTDTQWLDNATTLAFRRNAEGKLQDLKEDGATEDVVNYITIGTVSGGTLGSVVSLAGQTPAPAQTVGYDTPINMTIVPGKYLGVYDYAQYSNVYTGSTDPDGIANVQAIIDDLKKLDFDMKIMSALDKGTVVPHSGSAFNVIAASTGNNIAKIDKSHIDGFNYNNVYYDVFPVNSAAKNVDPAVAAWTYTYIKDVVFYIPTSEGTKYNFVTKGAAYLASPTHAILDVWTGDTATAGYVLVQPNNLTSGEATKLGVRITDRFGKVKEAEVPFTITMQ